MTGSVTALELTTSQARSKVRALMPVEADLAFRRRCETVVEFLDAGSDARILDCGCGYGFMLKVLSEMTGAALTGVDPDQSRLDHARANLPVHDRVSFVAGSANALPFGDGRFSHVVCSEVLEHLDDDGTAVAELYRVLEPGGIVVITVPSADYPFGWDPPNYVLEHVTGRHLGGERPWSGIWFGHQRLYQPEALRNLLTEAGFEVVEERPLTHVCPPFAHLLLYGVLKPVLMKGWLPRRLAKAGNRFQSQSAQPRGLDSWAMRVLERIDRPNDDALLVQRKRTFVALSIKARKPL